MAERSGRHDLAIGLLEKARQHRPNDPRLLWTLGRTYGMVTRTEEKLAEADSLLGNAAEQAMRRIYPAIHRDIAYTMASQSEDCTTAAGHLRQLPRPCFRRNEQSTHFLRAQRHCGPGLSRHRREGVRNPVPAPAAGRSRDSRKVPGLKPRHTARAESRN